MLHSISGFSHLGLFLLARLAQRGAGFLALGFCVLVAVLEVTQVLVTVLVIISAVVQRGLTQVIGWLLATQGRRLAFFGLGRLDLVLVSVLLHVLSYLFFVFFLILQLHLSRLRVKGVGGVGV